MCPSSCPATRAVLRPQALSPGPPGLRLEPCTCVHAPFLCHVHQYSRSPKEGEEEEDGSETLGCGPPGCV